VIVKQYFWLYCLKDMKIDFKDVFW
jgi:hypothetical protein